MDLTVHYTVYRTHAHMSMTANQDTPLDRDMSCGHVTAAGKNSNVSQRGAPAASATWPTGKWTPLSIVRWATISAWPTLIKNITNTFKDTHGRVCLQITASENNHPEAERHKPVVTTEKLPTYLAEQLNIYFISTWTWNSLILDRSPVWNRIGGVQVWISN